MDPNEHFEDISVWERIKTMPVMMDLVRILMAAVATLTGVVTSGYQTVQVINDLIPYF